MGSFTSQSTRIVFLHFPAYSMKQAVWSLERGHAQPIWEKYKNFAMEKNMHYSYSFHMGKILDPL